MVPSIARAEPLPPPLAPEATSERSYGNQTLGVDVAGAAVGLGAYAGSSSWRHSAAEPPGLPAYLATSMYGVGLIGGPIVHWANGRTGVGFADFGSRLVAPPVVGLGGMLFGCIAPRFESCARDGMIAGTLVGAVGVAAVDSLLLARERSPRTPPIRRRWYGWQTLAVDGALMGFGAYTASRPRDPPKPGQHEYSDLLYFGVGWYAFSWLAAPIVHLAHGRIGIGFADAGVRLVMPALAVLPGLLVACSGLGGRDGCIDAGVAGGFVGGMALAAGLDAFVFAREPAEAPTNAPASALLTVNPLPGGGLAVGMAGRF